MSSSTNQNIGYQKLLADATSSYEDDHLTTPVDLDTLQPWSSGLSNCCSDVPLCCLTCWCPCITFGRIAEAFEDGKTSCIASAGIHAFLTYATGCGWVYSFMYRSKIRKHYKLSGSPFQDCLAHFCCERCALCQEYRQLRQRGVAIGVDAGEKKYGVEVVPIAPEGMTR